MTTPPHDKSLSELKTRLAKLPKADRGISWQLYNWQHTEELTVYGSTANCLKWILDNTEEIIAALHTPIEAGNGGDATALSPAELFAKWLQDGPRLAKAAGCYVGIKVTDAPSVKGERQ